MRNRLYAATNDGLVVLTREDATWKKVATALEGTHVTSVTAQAGLVLAGSRQGVQRSPDGENDWREANQGLAIRYVRWLDSHDERSGLAWAGTESAAIFTTTDGGEQWEIDPTIPKLRDRNDWYLPYSNGAGCVRGFDSLGNRVYGAVEVGGALRSDDGGRSWRLVEGSTGDPQTTPAGKLIHPDVHSIVVHESSKDRVVAPTGGGLYRSADGGDSWDFLYDCYCRAAWIDPEDWDHLIFGPADGVSRNGRIEESHDGGQTWSDISINLDTPWPQDMIERFLPVEDRVLAIVTNGQVLSSPAGQWAWEPILSDDMHVNALAYVS